jgi:hypothetical protein
MQHPAPQQGPDQAHCLTWYAVTGLPPSLLGGCQRSVAEVVLIPTADKLQGLPGLTAAVLPLPTTDHRL